MARSFILDTRRSDVKILAGFLFTTIGALAAHILFSWIGYNPTDDGFTLAYSRRLLDGQIPHLDFIIIRPFLSPVLHMPLVLIGGDSLYWWSRAFIWFQWSSMAWLWTMTLNRLAGRPFGIIDCLAAALICATLNANRWPVMAWHTIDGLWLATLGVALVYGRPNRALRFIGYLLLGAAYLCKQSFILAAPLALLIHRDWRDLRLWLAAALPGIAYVSYLALTGALWEAYHQLFAHSSLSGVFASNQRALSVIVFLGYIGFRLIEGTPSIVGLADKPRIRTGLGAGLIVAILTFNFVIPAFFQNMFSNASYNLAALLLGGALYFILEKSSAKPFAQLIIMILVLAWSATVSVGARTPALMSGTMFLALLTVVLSSAYAARWRSIILLFLAVLAAISFYSTRHRFVYMEQPAERLVMALDGVFPGGKGIKTNPNTHAFLVDLQAAVTLAKKHPDPYAILPDVPGYWAQADQANPLPIDWAKQTELPNAQLLQRVTDALDNQRSKLTVIVQKFEAFPLSRGFTRLISSDKFAVARHVRQKFLKCGETKYFELYR